MGPRLERELREMAALASRVMEEGRAPTPEERARFQALRRDLDAQPPGWRDRLVDEIDRFAAALESMGI